MFDRFTPLVGSSNVALRHALAFPDTLYSERFVDAVFWRPFVDLICAELGVQPIEVTSGEPGSFPTFMVDRSWVVKLFGEPFDGLRCWRVELEVASALGREIAGIALPDMIGAGVLAREPAWRFIVSRFIDGVPFATARDSLDREERCALAGRLGVMVRDVHDRAVPDGIALPHGWTDWRSFVARQRVGLVERHRRWKVLPERLIGQLDEYVAEYVIDEARRPSLVHADLHQDHVLVRAGDDGKAQVHGVIDWGDARVGDPFYELPALHLGLFRGDTRMLAAFLEAYGWDGFRSDSFIHRAMTMTLLHEFNVLDDVLAMIELDACISLDAFAEMIWRV